MIREYDSVVLIDAAPGSSVPVGTQGAVVMALGDGKAFAVEFFDTDGNTIAVDVVPAETLSVQKHESGITL
jgi:hypothetical protein